MQLTMDVNIENVKFEEVLPMWERLWPGRDDIKPTNSMVDCNGTIDMALYDKAAEGIKFVFTVGSLLFIFLSTISSTIDDKCLICS